MATIYYEHDADPSVITSRKVAIIGYGSQARPSPSTSGTLGGREGGAAPGSSSRAKARRPAFGP